MKPLLGRQNDLGRVDGKLDSKLPMVLEQPSLLRGPFFPSYAKPSDPRLITI